MIIISLLGRLTISLREDLDKAGITYQARRPGVKGQIMNSAEWVLDLAKFAKENAGWALAVASVLIAWIRASTKRKITVTLKDGRTYSTEGLSPDDFAAVLHQTREVLAIEAGNDLRDPVQPEKENTQ